MWLWQLFTHWRMVFVGLVMMDSAIMYIRMSCKRGSCWMSWKIYWMVECNCIQLAWVGSIGWRCSLQMVQMSRPPSKLGKAFGVVMCTVDVWVVTHAAGTPLGGVPTIEELFPSQL